LEPLEGRDVPAAVGALDPSFATGGKLTVAGTTFGAVALQPDGKIVAVGGQAVGVDLDFLVARFNPDGTPDTTFNTTGTKTIDFNGANDNANAVAIQSDGKIVVAGNAGNDFGVTRLNTDGTLDTTFGINGLVDVDFNGHTNRANGLAIAANGNLYVAGTVGVTTAEFGFGLLALNPAGAPLASFGNNGRTAVNLVSQFEGANAIAIQPDGKLVVAGVVDPLGSDFAVIRLDPTTGQLDTGFGTQGLAEVNFGPADDTAQALVIQPDGDIIAAGITTPAGRPNSSNAALARLTPAGVLDTTFGTGGKTSFQLSAPGGINAAALQPDGEIVVVGSNSQDVVVGRMTAGGAVDTSFGTAGSTTVDTTAQNIAKGLVLQPDGRIVVAGVTNGGDGFIVRLIGTVQKVSRLAVSGSPDGTADVFTPDPTGQYGTTPATVPAVGGPGTARTAVGDVNGDGIPDTVVVTGPAPRSGSTWSAGRTGACWSSRSTRSGGTSPAAGSWPRRTSTGTGRPSSWSPRTRAAAPGSPSSR
jgi:uncharacterized delta-60 repeat protein